MKTPQRMGGNGSLFGRDVRRLDRETLMDVVGDEHGRDGNAELGSGVVKGKEEGKDLMGNFMCGISALVIGLYCNTGASRNVMLH